MKKSEKYLHVKKMFPGFLETVFDILSLISKYGGIASIAILIIMFIFPGSLDNFLGRIIATSIIGATLLAIAMLLIITFVPVYIIFFGWIGRMIFKDSAYEYEDRKGKGENKTKVFAITSFKAIIQIIILVLFVLLLIWGSLNYEDY